MVVREGFLEEEPSVGVRIKEEETAEAKKLLWRLQELHHCFSGFRAHILKLSKPSDPS